MREFLLRGKRTDNGEWITDSETYIRDGDGIWLSDENLNVVTVIPETVGQFTGLTDKNGKRIFEGDIVRYDVNYHDMVISYDVENWGGWLYEDMDDNMQAYSIYEFCLKDIAVVGNIHDNPDIIKGGGDNG